VIVNGTVVVDGGEVLRDVNPGQPIRHEPRESLFEPLDVDAWTQAFYAVPQDFGGGIPNSQPAYDPRVIPCCQ
jgi:hypothetical protein